MICSLCEKPIEKSEAYTCTSQGCRHTFCLPVRTPAYYQHVATKNKIRGAFMGAYDFDEKLTVGEVVNIINGVKFDTNKEMGQ